MTVDSERNHKQSVFILGRAPPLPGRFINVSVECSTLHSLFKHLLKALTVQTISVSVIFEMRCFPYRKTTKFRCGSLAGRAGSKHTGEFHSGNHRARLKIYKPQGKCIADTTHRSKDRQKHTHYTHTGP